MTIGRRIRRAIKSVAVSNPIARSSVARIAGDLPRVFMYHRFRPAGVIANGHTTLDSFRRQLDLLQREGEIVSFGDCVSTYNQTGRWPRNSRVITVDDGHRDFYEVAYPELERRGIPATFFVVAGFVDRRVWLWPDVLNYAIGCCEATSVQIDMDGRERSFRLEGTEERARAWSVIATACLSMPNDERLAFIDHVVERLGVVLPETPSADFEACTWDELREMSDHGIEIGCHTMTHPILSKIGEEQYDFELGASKDLIEREIGKPVESFCYPNAGWADINDAVVEAVRRHGYAGAALGNESPVWDPYTVPRVHTADDEIDFGWRIVVGRD